MCRCIRQTINLIAMVGSNNCWNNLLEFFKVRTKSYSSNRLCNPQDTLHFAPLIETGFTKVLIEFKSDVIYKQSEMGPNYHKLKQEPPKE